jgi:hypothetical protein
MHHTVAGDRWKDLKISAWKLDRDARALQKAARAPASPHGDAMTASACDWPWQRPRPSGWIDLMEILVKESRNGSCTYRMDGARKIDAAKARQKAGAMKAAALVIK